MNNIKDLREKIEQYLIEECEIPKEQVLNPDTRLEDLELDSIDKAELALQLDEEFDIIIQNDQTLMEMQTIGEVFDYFIKQYQEQNQ